MSQEHNLDVPGQKTLNYGNDDVLNISPHKCCYFLINEYYDYRPQVWSREKSTTVMDKPDLIRIRYNQMRIFPSDFIHDDGINNTGSIGNYRIQLLIIEKGQNMFGVVKYHNDTIRFENISDKDLLLYNFEEKDSNYNNRSVRNYAYSSIKT